MRIPKEMRPVAKKARDQGWTISTTKGGHIVWQSPTGKKVFSPSSPSEYRGHKNVIRKLRHEGLDI